ncbi:MAG: beta-galactosidase [Acidobacteriaceae bacterium]
MSRTAAALGAFLLLCPSVGNAQGQRARTNGVPSAVPLNLVRVDASRPVAPPEVGFLHLGGRSANGHDLEINSRYLTLDGKPMLPVMGEFHFSRYPADEWEDEILKMKAGGVNVVATYIFWIHHEEIEGQWNWSGQRDLRRFVELCAKHGMYVYIRIGPWDHGEVRNGGFPDWLLKLPNLRTNDPAYLARVVEFDRQIAMQLKGLLWKDGGPVIGAQIENEYGLHGPGKGSEHIQKLKELAIAAGIDVPIYSVTGWPSLDFPPHDVIPVSGGYPDGFWYGSLTNLPPSLNYLFNLNRKLGDMGATVRSEDPTGKVDLRHDPYFGAEEAGGMEDAYHRRPLIRPDDIAALTLAGIGSGLNLYGYYMYHGGANPAGERSTLQESQATGYPNDLPEINYDFQAPLGEYGQVRESYRKTRLMHLFLNAFGSELAQMTAVGPKRVPANPADTSVPRVAVRARGDSAFIFVNNYVRQLPMPERTGFQVQLKLPGSQILVPAKPLTVPANSYFCWPVNLAMNGVRLQYSTAQLLTKIDTSRESIFVFFAIPGVAPEFSFDARSVQSVSAPGLTIVRTGSMIRVRPSSRGADAEIDAVGKDGRRIRILLLTQGEAESATVVRVSDGDHLLLSPSDVFFDGNLLHLRSTDHDALHFRVFPTLAAGAASDAKMSVEIRGPWTEFSFDRPKVSIAWTLKQTRNALPVAPVKLGPFFGWRNGRVAEAPKEIAFAAAAEWKITLTQPLPAGISNLWLDLDYVGDIGRLYVGDRLVDDDFFHGATWQIGLKRFLPAALSSGIRVQVLPLRADAPIYLDPSVRAKLPRTGQVATIGRPVLVPEYEIVIPLHD